MDAYSKALSLLAMREHGRNELEDKLVKKGYAREDVSLALFDVGGIGETVYTPANGTIRFSCSDETDSTWQEHAWLDADITLRATGDTPIDFRGHLYAP